MNKAVFLDRDGVVNFERGDYVSNPKDFVINQGVLQAIKMFRDNNFLVIIITNQGGIAKKLYSINDVMLMHNRLIDELKQNNSSINDIYMCPHHDNYGKCLCRKPGSLLFEKALAVYNIDPAKSFMIGDSQRDVDAAEKLGITSFLINPNENILRISQKIIGEK